MAEQLGFDALLGDTDKVNEARALERATAHMPSTVDTALDYFREILNRHHEEMLAANVEAVMDWRKEAHQLAARINGGAFGILAGPDAPGCALARLTAAPSGTVPIWGQTGEFIITVGTMRVRIVIEGVFGIGGSIGYWPGFGAHIVDTDKPFFSETGYQSFLGVQGNPVPDLTPDRFAALIVAPQIERAAKPTHRRHSLG